MKRKSRTIAIVLGVLAVLLLWHQVFVMTGVLWWNAPAPAERLPGFAAIRLPRPDISLVDLDLYMSAHPEWRPQ